MRPRVILTAFGLAALMLLPAFYFHRTSLSPRPTPAPAKEESKAAPVDPLRFIPVPSKNRLRDGQDERPVASVPNHAAYVVERKAELGNLATTGGSDGLSAILSELDNPDPAIRKAALVAVVDVGSQDSIPALQNRIEWASDPQEKVDLQRAIDFLQLPPAQPAGLSEAQ